jgi:hypothetical protein
VEIFYLHDKGYYQIFIDGEQDELIDGAYPIAAKMLKRKFHKHCVKKTGVSENLLTFVYYDFHSYACKHIGYNQYDCNEYANYENILGALKKYGTDLQMTYWSTGTEALEECDW